MKKRNYIILVLFILIANLVFAQEQTPDSTLRVITKIDGTEYIGKIISDDGREVLITTDLLGNIYIPKSDIKSILKVDDTRRIVYGEFRETGPFTTRYSFTNNAHPVTKGENYALINLYGPEVHFALTDNFSLGIMSTWIASPMILALKYSIPTNNPNLNFSIGTLMGTSGYLNTFRGYMGLHWANVTVGNRMNNISFSGGYGYLDLGFTSFAPGTYYNVYPDETHRSLVQGPMASIAGIVKVGTKVSFVFDSMFMILSGNSTSSDFNRITDGEYDTNGDWVEGDFTIIVTENTDTYIALMLMPGLRFQKSENNAFQFNLSGVTLIGEDETISFPFPMCTWFIKF